jgi:hypothetical protein
MRLPSPGNLFLGQCQANLKLFFLSGELFRPQIWCQIAVVKSFPKKLALWREDKHDQ